MTFCGGISGEDNEKCFEAGSYKTSQPMIRHCQLLFYNSFEFGIAETLLLYANENIQNAKKFYKENDWTFGGRIFVYTNVPYDWSYCDGSLKVLRI